MSYMIGEMAALAGVSIRTLHHYDAIGLLVPTAVGENGYRRYDRVALERLQQILIYRALGVPLVEIRAILDDPSFDRMAALQTQRERVAAEAQRCAAMLATIDRTIAQAKGERTMTDADLYSGLIDPARQADYETWLVETYGPEMAEAIQTSKAALAAQPEGAMADLKPIEQRLATAMTKGVSPDDPDLAPMLAEHRDWVARAWGKSCGPEAYAGLAAMYLAHPDFVARYEAIAPGFSQFLPAAMTAWAAREQ